MYRCNASYYHRLSRGVGSAAYVLCHTAKCLGTVALLVKRFADVAHLEASWFSGASIRLQCPILSVIFYQRCGCGVGVTEARRPELILQTTC